MVIRQSAHVPALRFSQVQLPQSPGTRLPPGGVALLTQVQVRVHSLVQVLHFSSYTQVESPNFPKLKVLRINDNRLTKNVVKCLLETKHLSSLVRIQVTRGELGNEAFAELGTRFVVVDW